MLHTRELVSEILTHKKACPIHSEEGEGEGEGEEDDEDCQVESCLLVLSVCCVEKPLSTATVRLPIGLLGYGTAGIFPIFYPGPFLSACT